MCVGQISQTRDFLFLFDFDHITHSQFNLLVVVVLFHPVVGVGFCLDAVGQTVVVAQIDRHAKREFIADTATQSSIRTAFQFIPEQPLGLFHTRIAQR